MIKPHKRRIYKKRVGAPRLPSMAICIENINRRAATIGWQPIIDIDLLERFEKAQAEFERGQALDRLYSFVVWQDDDPCWMWSRALSEGGYGLFYFRGKQNLAHRVSYVLHVGEIEDGLVIDHKCRRRSCVNPKHLEPVTILENNNRGLHARGMARGTSCPNGHPYTSENTRHVFSADRGGRHYRRCQTCINSRMRYVKLENRNELV